MRYFPFICYYYYLSNQLLSSILSIYLFVIIIIYRTNYYNRGFHLHSNQLRIRRDYSYSNLLLFQFDAKEWDLLYSNISLE